MKAVFAVLALAASAFAQGIAIFSPAAGQNITAGNGVEVVVQKPDSLTGSTDIGVAVLIQHCTQNPCEDVSQDLGTVFYAGAFTPTRQQGVADGQPAQQFFASVPQSFPKGPAVLSVPHSVLVGAGPNFVNEIVNVTINIS
ncbi:hypothetical protein SCHPADRAFT_906568 [Schizopora paradoxa]|uniref:Uncharacterized protein n=1 Tax=Schizopora paradoxa TaxID=27342 RepID=A0A0H2RG00_9AGAM|nr:hypothetical protein SCHPADRAFT_906568 [Schizopora paradoxa]